MTIKRMFIYTLGCFCCLGIFALYGTLIIGKDTIPPPTVAMPSNTASIAPSSLKTNTSCEKDVSQVRIYAYMFHYIIPDVFIKKENKIEYGNSISPEKLEEILKKLDTERKNKTIEVVNLYDLEKFKDTNCFPGKNIVLLTVDDGWDDGYNFLFPLAKKYNISFNLGIISSKVSKTPSEINNFLNEWEIQEMLDSKFFTLASHSTSHIELRNLSGSILEKELGGSKTALETLFHAQINTIIFPSGKYDELSIEKAKSYWYTFGFTTKGGAIHVKDLAETPFTLPRIRINRDTNIEKVFSFDSSEKTSYGATKKE